MHFVGKGGTDFSVSKMKQCVEAYNFQLKDIAPLLQSPELRQTLQNVQDFAHWHFDYDADLTDQLIRSPACSWYQRYDGIDCKSYSIIISCLLTQLGISHYIRKVAYKIPQAFTHVYVVVPTDQKSNHNSFRCDSQHYVLDGTVNQPIEYEISYKDCRDEYMDGLDHYILNGPLQPGLVQLNGLNLSFLKKISFNNLKSIFNNIRCWGGTAYGPDLFEANINKLANLMNEIIASMNDAIARGDLEQVADDYTDFIGYASILWEGQHSVDAYGDWNTCTTKNLQAFWHTCEYFKNIFPALNAYIDKYFNKTKIGTKAYTTIGLESQGWTFMEVEGHTYTYNYDFYRLSFKNMVTAIPAFEFTAPLTAVAEGAPLDIPKWIDSLQNIIHTVGVHPNDGGIQADGPAGSYETTDGGDGSGNLNQAGFGGLAAWGILGASVLVAMNWNSITGTNKNAKKAA